jgi:hypothetical protein
LGEWPDRPANVVRSTYLKTRTRTDAAGYYALFDAVNGEKAVGEASTTYLSIERAAGRIRDRHPGARLIAVLRQPAERAFSQFMFNRKLFNEPIENFAEALDREPQRIAEGAWVGLNYRRRSFYYDDLKRFYDLFPREQIAVYLHDDLRDRPEQTMRQVFGFLGVDDRFMPDMSVRYNTSGEPRRGAVRSAMRMLRPVLRRVLPHMPPRLVSRMGDAALQRRKLAPELHARLTEEFREDILAVGRLIGRDLSAWLS